MVSDKLKEEGERLTVFLMVACCFLFFFIGYQVNEITGHSEARLYFVSDVTLLGQPDCLSMNGSCYTDMGCAVFPDDDWIVCAKNETMKEIIGRTEK